MLFDWLTGRRGDKARAAAVRAAAPVVEFTFQGNTNPFLADAKFPLEAFHQLVRDGTPKCTVRNVLFCQFTYGSCWMFDLGYGVDSGSSGHELCESFSAFRFSDKLHVPFFHLAPRGDESPWRHATPGMHDLSRVLDSALHARYNVAGVEPDVVGALFTPEIGNKLTASPSFGRWRVDGAGSYIVVSLMGALSDTTDLKTHYARMEQVAGVVGAQVTRLKGAFGA